MKLTIYQVDAFTNRLFGGNPAAVIPLDKWIDDKLMQDIAMENNLADTAFFVSNADGFDIRWFTPVLEISLCGHATLASAFVLYNIKGYDKPKLLFNSKSGKLIVEKKGDTFLMDFPSWKPEKINEYPAELQTALGVKEIVAVYKYRDLLVELNSEDDVKKVQPDFTALKKMGQKVIITAPESLLILFPVSSRLLPVLMKTRLPVQRIHNWSLSGMRNWVKKLCGQNNFHNAGGDIYCDTAGDRVIMGGECKFYMKGEIET